MSSRHFTLVALILCGAVCASAAEQPAHAGKKKPSPVQQTQTQAPPKRPAPPEPPATPEHGPASPPEVTLRGGQLTIVARNSTLGDVLNAVRSKTGASIEMPPASSERVVGQFGPGAPRDVVAQLLNGSHYDYVLLGSPEDAGALKTIVLTVRPTGPEPVQQASNPAPGYNPGMQAVPQAEQDQQDQPPDEVNNDVQPEPPPQAEQEEMQGEQPGEQPPPPNPAGGPTVKTPEQLLRELQQQQQQQQQQQNQAPPQQ
jgi:hypothetical protein